MNKGELIDKIAKDAKISKVQANGALNSAMDHSFPKESLLVASVPPVFVMARLCTTNGDRLYCRMLRTELPSSSLSLLFRT
jgi:hypothetical protein